MIQLHPCSWKLTLDRYGRPPSSQSSCLWVRNTIWFNPCKNDSWGEPIDRALNSANQSSPLNNRDSDRGHQVLHAPVQFHTQPPKACNEPSTISFNLFRIPKRHASGKRSRLRGSAIILIISPFPTCLRSRFYWAHRPEALFEGASRGNTGGELETRKNHWSFAAALNSLWESIDRSGEP